MSQPRKIEELIIHCTATPESMDIGVEDIDTWHQQRGWSGINHEGIQIYCGYHYVIRLDGTVEIGRPDQYMGAHCRGHNARSIGIALVGTKCFNDVQMYSLLSLCRVLMHKYMLTDEDVVGHNQYNFGKDCPNLNMDELRETLGQMIPNGGRMC